MIFGEVATGDALGAILAHSLAIDGERWNKGRRLNEADIARAAASGVVTLTVARPGADDIAEDDAADALAAALAGSGVVATRAAHGRANLVATQAGVLLVDAAAVDAVNAVDEGLTLGTLAAYARVAAGEVVATVKIIPYAVAAADLAQAIAATRSLGVAGFAPRRYVLIQTMLAGTSAKMMAKTEQVTGARIAALGGTMDASPRPAHTVEALAACLAAQPAEAIVLVAGASATVDRRDVIPAAIIAAGGHVERLGMPVDPGNLLCLGTLDARAVIGLPGCARSAKRNGFDWVLERLAAGVPVAAADIARMGVGGLLPDAERPEPRAVPAAARGPVGAIVLAAGRSTRMGPANKLLADLAGKPVVAHVVDAVAAAGLPPPIIVVGHMAAEVRAALGRRSATYVEAADFAEGMSRSLRAGLAAVPADWRAVLVVLGDMPSVGAATLAMLAAAATNDAVVAAPVWAGKRGNPLLWGRAHLPRLAAIDGDVGGKALLADLAAHVIEVAADNDGVLADVDTPEALAAMRAGS